MKKVNFHDERRQSGRIFARAERNLVGHVPTIAITPVAGTKFMAASLEYFPGDGLSSHYRTLGGMWDRFGGDDFRACARLGPLYR